jgi:predicted dehydrogenase
MEQIRIGIVGCGEVVQIIHLPSLSQLRDQFTVTALCDASPTVLDAVGHLTGVTWRTTDYRALVARDDVDAVLVTNPHAFHAEVALAAIAAGKHVLVEKPMCFTLAEADAMIAAQERAGLVVQVGYMRRYAPAFLEACRAVREMGEIRLARVHDLIGRNALITEPTSRVIRGSDIPDDLIGRGRAMQTDRVREAVGEVSDDLARAYLLLLGLGTHDISAMREMLGMPQGIIYAAQRQHGRYLTAAFDYGEYLCHYETGVDEIPRFDAGLTVCGADCVVRVTYDTPYVRNMPIRLHVTQANGQGGVIDRAEHLAWGDPFVAEWQAFYENVTQGRAPKTPPADFRQDLTLFIEMIRLMQVECGRKGS